MIKSSNQVCRLKESCRRWDGSSFVLGEWTYEGDRKRICVALFITVAFLQVAVDGRRTRYNGGPYDSTVNEWTAFF